MACFVLGPNRPLHMMEGFVKRIRKEHSIDNVIMAAKGVFLVRFLEF